MGLPLPPSVIPMSAAGANRVVPFLRIVPVAATVAPAAAGGGFVGALAGTALPLVASFALGYEIGTQLIKAWNWLNQALQQTPLTPADGDTATWPTPKPGQTVTYAWVWVSHGYFEPFYAERVYRSTTAIPTATVLDPNAYYQGFGQARIEWGGSSPGSTIGGTPGFLRLQRTTTSDGLPPESATTSSGFAPSRAPLVNALGQPLAFVPPADPVAPEIAPAVPTRREAPKLPPMPGTPAPLPSRITPAPGGSPGRAPGGSPLGPGVLPEQIPQPGRIGQPTKQPAPATMPTVDPARPPQTVPNPGTAPLPVPVPVPVTPADLIRVGNLIVGEPSERPRANLEAIATELGRQEQKLAGLLQGNGLGGILQTELINALREAVKDLFNDVPAGSFQLIPPCPPPGGGDPLPPVVVPYDGATNPSLGILAKLDGIAGLIQAHKNMGQPTCRTVIHGEEVTVHFESDP